MPNNIDDDVRQAVDEDDLADQLVAIRARNEMNDAILHQSL
jgi:hypothetical protein